MEFSKRSVAQSMVLALVLALPLSAQSEAGQKRTVLLPRVDTIVEVDGFLDEPVWQQSYPRESFFILRTSNTPKIALADTCLSDQAQVGIACPLRRTLLPRIGMILMPLALV